MSSRMRTALLCEVAEIERNGIDPADIPDGTIYLGLEHIEQGGRILAAGAVANGDLASTKFRFSKRHVLYGKLRPYLAKIAVPSFNGICSTDILPILPGPKLDRMYLTHFLRQPSIVALATSRAEGANLPRLSPKTLANFEIPLPPLEEQRRIAAILDAADSLRAKRRAALAKLGQLAQSIFIEMFGDPVSNPMGWPVDKFGNVGTLDRGVSKHRPRNAPELLGGTHPLIQTGDVANSDGYIRAYNATYSDLGLRQSKKWPSGTLCITIAANIADTGILTFDACFPDSVVGFSPGRGVTIDYVQFWLSFLRSWIEATAPVVAQKNINLAILRDLDIPVPPRQKQELFSARRRQIEDIKYSIRTATEHQDALFQSLQHRAFRGEL